MSKDYYDVLGVHKTASQDEIKAAFRKLAMEHHPDREGGDAEKFKAINEANEILKDPEKRAAYDRHGSGFQEGLNARRHHDPFAAAFEQMHEHIRRNAVQAFTLNISIEKAFKGTKIQLNAYGHTVSYDLKPGLPPGVSFIDMIEVGGEQRKIQIHLLIDAGKFLFRQIGSADGVNFNGDLETFIEVDALDIMLGAWVIVKDFLGKELSVRIPAGFDTSTTLKVAKHGYMNWHGDSNKNRADLYVNVKPKFTSPDKLDAAKVKQLYELAHPVTKPATVT